MTLAEAIAHLERVTRIETDQKALRVIVNELRLLQAAQAAQRQYAEAAE